MNVLILGAGGHGQTVADALLRVARAGGPMRPVGFLDDTPALQDWDYCGVPVLGRLERIADVGHDGIIVAIGDNRARRRLFLRLQSAGRQFVSVIHPTAVVAFDVEIGPGCYIGANAVVGPAARIGANTIVNGVGGLGHHSRIGDHVHVGPGVVAAGGVHVGEGTQIGLGTNIVPKCSIGRWSVVGGGSLVARDIPDGVLALGNPARPVRRLELPVEG